MVRILIVLISLFLLLPLPITAQGGDIVLTLAVNEFFKDAFSETLLAQFEAQHPGVRVELVTSTMAGAVTSPASDIDGHLDGLRNYAESADVLLVSNNNLSVEGTRSGIFMDFSPLANADSTLNPDDFLPQAWASFQWERGIWALPVAVDVMLLVYNPAAFDELGIAYPNEAWTFDDFANAIRTLTRTDTNGEVTPGFFDFGTSTILLRSLLGHALADDITMLPDFSDPDLARYLTTWQELIDEGAVGGFTGGEQVIAIGGGIGDGPPMSIQRSFALATFPRDPNSIPPSGSLLPGGVAGLDVQGFAISAGTRYPEQAYELAKFLTHSAEVANGLFGSAPARRSLAGVEVEPPEGGRGRIIALSSLTYPAENQVVIDQAFDSALPFSEMHYMGYISAAFNLMQTDGLDAQTALQQVEASAIANLNAAETASETMIVNVATPVPAIALAPDEVVLNFGISSFINPLPNQQLWDQIIDDFAASDTDVGRIDLGTDFGFSISDMAGSFDCFYLPTNAVPGGDLASIISLDPFIDADPLFDKNDLIGNTLAQVQFDNRTWALPIVIQPEVLRYNPDLFAQAGVPAPENGWTVDQFVDALRRLKPTADDPTPFVPRDFSGQYLYTLIVAFGGLPIDQRTTPPTLNFTDPATVDAIRQVLDLAKDGYFDYSAMAGGGGRVDVSIAVGGSEDEDPIYTHTLSGLSFFTRLDTEGNLAADPYSLVPYPRGSRYTPITFDVGTAYISAEAENAEACYRWLSALSGHPELFSAMPTRRSLITQSVVSPDLAALYQQLDTILSDPNTVISVPPVRGDGANAANRWRQFWLNRVFDRYVLEDTDLDSELAQAEQFTRDYEQCIAGIPRQNPTTQEERFDYFQQFSTCASSVDPSAV